MKILVLGSKGQLGRCLRDQLCRTKNKVVYASRNEIDIGDLLNTQKIIRELKPEVIVNAAAYTAVDIAEVELWWFVVFSLVEKAVQPLL